MVPRRKCDDRCTAVRNGSVRGCGVFTEMIGTFDMSPELLTRMAIEDAFQPFLEREAIEFEEPVGMFIDNV